MIKWTGLTPWEFEFPFPGRLTFTSLRAALPKVDSAGPRCWPWYLISDIKMNMSYVRLVFTNMYNIFTSLYQAGTSHGQLQDPLRQLLRLTFSALFGGDRLRVG